jgi:hypothetical protein
MDERVEALLEYGHENFHFLVRKRKENEDKDLFIDEAEDEYNEKIS